MPYPQPLKVIYIMSFSRSGSTLLDIILGNHKQIYSCGELMRLISHGWINQELCSCHEKITECEFWSEVINEWQKETKLEPEELLGLQNKYERLRSLPIVLINRVRPSKSFRAYQAATLSLLELVAKKAGKKIIIDSSKSTARFLALSSIKNLKIQPIHLVRDSRAVAWSMAKPYKQDLTQGIEQDMPSESLTKTAINWLFFNLQVCIVSCLSGIKKPLLVRYEDLTAFPKETLSRISNYCDCDPVSLINILDKKAMFKIKHIAAGNRLRMKNEIKIQHDSDWENAMPEKQKSKVTRLTELTLKKYGYNI